MSPRTKPEPSQERATLSGTPFAWSNGVYFVFVTFIHNLTITDDGDGARVPYALTSPTIVFND